ncbi:MAG: AAA family ATPase [Succinivibrio sp.]|nr:AAA family ATPase [Succinivibrio sp.]
MVKVNMIKSIKISNFRCIRQLKVDLSYGLNKAPNGYKDHSSWPFIELYAAQKKSRLVPCFLLYGANASGKTTILRALAVMQSVIGHRFNPRIHYSPNAIIEELANEPSTITCEFYTDAHAFEYTLELGRRGLVAERLCCDDAALFSVLGARLAGHSLGARDDELQETFLTRCVDVKNHSQIRSFLGAFVSYLPGLSAQINAAYDFLMHSLVVVLTSGDLSFHHTYEALFAKAGQEERLELEESLQNYLKKLDFNILGLDFYSNRENTARMSEIPDRVEHPLPFEPSPSEADREHEPYIYNVLTRHLTSKNREVKFSFNDESVGTQKAISLLLLFLRAVRSGQTVLVDELDNSIHTFLVRELLKIFTERDSNCHAAQLIATVQNPELLSGKLLSSSELGFVSYSKKEGASIFRPVEDDSLRASDNFRRLYLNGEWGGIPFPLS